MCAYIYNKRPVINYGEGGQQNGNIASPNLDPTRQGKTFRPPLLRGQNCMSVPPIHPRYSIAKTKVTLLKIP